MIPPKTCHHPIRPLGNKNCKSCNILECGNTSWEKCEWGEKYKNSLDLWLKDLWEQFVQNLETNNIKEKT